MTRFSQVTLCLIITVGLGGSQTFARSFQTRPDATTTPNSASPAYCNAEHNIGNIVVSVSNDGTFGNGLSIAGIRDCFTGQQVKSCEFPKGSQSTYLWAADLWIGAIRGRDTLVSTSGMGGSEFHPDEAPFGSMIYRSNIDPARPEFKDAVSEQDYVAVYYDTCRTCQGVGNDALDGRGHIPLQIEVTQRSFAWSYSYAEDFILMDYSIKNIGDTRLKQVYMGIFVDADVYSLADQTGNGYEDDLSGFREKVPALYLKPPCPPDSDVVNLAWTVDNDGGLAIPSVFPPTPHVAATRVVRTPSDSLIVSYNWWVRPPQDYGPQARATYRDLRTGGLGSPSGDRNKYHFLSNGEFDFDQHRLATIDALDSVWIPPPADLAGSWATGIDVRYLLSFGPFDVEPGQSLPISLAYVCGEDFHTDGDNFYNLPANPDTWYENVNFDSLGVNATWADWVYDNPGVDTDSDGYAGEFTICNLGTDSTYKCDTLIDSSANPDTSYIECEWKYDLADTVWRKGDGIPDFRGASPPPSPAAFTVLGPDGKFIRGLRLDAGVGQITVRWNGIRSETTRDIFSRELDFEGYRVWMSRDDQASSYSVLASYDIEDYNRWVYNEVIGDFQLNEHPFTIADLRCMHGDSCNDLTFFPDSYTRIRPLREADGSTYYFVAQDYNRSVLDNDIERDSLSPIPNSPIKKTYPTAPKPDILEPDSIRILYPGDLADVYLTEEGFIKYYEYEFTIDDLLPTVPYWFNVTAFDYGSPKSGLEALETSPTLLPLVSYALPMADEVIEQDLKAFIYPNPYRHDGDYRARGFEGRADRSRNIDRTRVIHFANLAPRCKISIYSLDGDLVREIDHNFDPSDPLANHDTWDIITRNSQQAVSGLYYWTVEDEDGNVQVGKLVLIM